MMIYEEKYETSLEFAVSLLKGHYDRSIFRTLLELANDMDERRFKNTDPIEHFEFDIELTDDQENLFINSEAINTCHNWSPNLSELERKVIMLVGSIIRAKHAEVLKVLKCLERAGNISLSTLLKQLYPIHPDQTAK